MSTILITHIVNEHHLFQKGEREMFSVKNFQKIIKKFLQKFLKLLSDE